MRCFRWLTPYDGCARGMCMYAHVLPEIHNYTIRLHKYAKLTARESRIWARLFFWTEIRKDFIRWINCWASTQNKKTSHLNQGRFISKRREERRWFFSISWQRKRKIVDRRDLALRFMLSLSSWTEFTEWRICKRLQNNYQAYVLRCFLRQQWQHHEPRTMAVELWTFDFWP